MKKIRFFVMMVLFIIATIAFTACGSGKTNTCEKGEHSFEYCVNSEVYLDRCKRYNFGMETLEDETFDVSHVKLCNKCGKVVIEKHSFETLSNFPTDDDYEHYLHCTVCGAEIIGEHEYEENGTICKICDREKTSLRFDEYEDGYKAVLKSECLGEVVVPSTYNGKRVYLFDVEGANHCTWGLTKLTISEGVNFDIVSFDNYKTSLDINDNFREPEEGQEQYFDLVVKGSSSGSYLSGIFYCEMVKSIRLENITGLDDFAFPRCYYLEEFYAPNLTFTKENQEESNWSGIIPATPTLKHLTIGDMPINRLMMHYSTDDQDVNLESLTFTGEYCYGLEIIPSYHMDSASDYNVNAGNITFADSVKYLEGKMSHVETLDLNKIEHIGDYVFYDNTNLTSIDLSNVKYVGKGVFERCKNLEEVIGLSNVKYFGESAFYASGLKEVAIYDATVCTYAFQCNGLEKIYVGNGCVISASVFPYSLDNLTELYVGNITETDDVFFINSIFHNIGGSTESGTKVTIGKDVECIKTVWFQYISSTPLDSGMPNMRETYSHINELVFESGSKLKTIDPCAFAHTQLSGDIVLPDTVESVGMYAFGDNENLTSVSGGSVNLKIGYDVVVNTNVALEEENGVYYYGNEAIELKEGAADVAFRDGAKFVKYYQLSYSKEWQEVNFSIESAKTTLKSITLPDGIDEVPNDMFNGCTKLDTVNLPSSIEQIGENAFAYCSSLTAIDLSKMTKLTHIGDHTFEQCTNLASITLPDSVIELGEYAFANTALTSIDLSKTKITSLSVSLFSGLIELSTVSLPSTLIEISENVFEGSGITALDLSNTKVTTIEANTFKDCISLTEVKLPETLSGIKDNAFVGCTSLSTVNVNDDFELTASMFTGSAYKGRHIVNGYYIGKTLTKIDDLVTVIINDGITEIASGALDGVTLLKYIYIPASVKTLTESDFTAIDNLNMVFGSTSTSLVKSGNRSFGFKCLSTGIIYTTSDTEATVYGYIGASSNVTIPTIIEGKQVTRIKYVADYAYGSSTDAHFGFAGRSDITTIVIDGLANKELQVDGNVFGNMSSLKTVDLNLTENSIISLAYGMINGSPNVLEVKFYGIYTGYGISKSGSVQSQVTLNSTENSNMLSTLKDNSELYFTFVVSPNTSA